MPEPKEVLEEAYTAAVEFPSIAGLTLDQEAYIAAIAQNADSQKAVLAALTTSLVKKACDPLQDIRLHKIEMPGGYSGRSYDTNYITPLLADKFPRLAMKSGSGWLTRSLEQNHSFDLSFPGKIQSGIVKNAFLQILHDLQTTALSPEKTLQYLFALLLRKAEDTEIVITRMPQADEVTIEAVVYALHAHFFSRYRGAGASRLPVLAIYAEYQSLSSYARYQDKLLLPLKSHTTSDAKSSTVGDIEILSADSSYFEAVEVKHNIAISSQMIRNAYDKFKKLPLNRYYLLTTAEPNSVEGDEIRRLTRNIHDEHGCEVIVNGIMPSLKYYLRLADDTAAFVKRYSEALRADFTANTDLKETHLEKWNALLAAMTAKRAS